MFTTHSLIHPTALAFIIHHLASSVVIVACCQKQIDLGILGSLAQLAEHFADQVVLFSVQSMEPMVMMQFEICL